MRRICITGPESTGKTTLAQRLARSLNADWVPEAARVYAERVGRELTVHDVEPIAREHIALADAAAACAGQVLVLDQDLISTIVYGQAYYGCSSAWIESEAQSRLSDLYLLCDVDVAWTSDGVRDRPDGRHEMFAQFARALEVRGAHVVVIRGDWETRSAASLEAVRGLTS